MDAVSGSAGEILGLWAYLHVAGKNTPLKARYYPHWALSELAELELEARTKAETVLDLLRPTETPDMVDAVLDGCAVAKYHDSEEEANTAAYNQVEGVL